MYSYALREQQRAKTNMVQLAKSIAQQKLKQANRQIQYLSENNSNLIPIMPIVKTEKTESDDRKLYQNYSENQNISENSNRNVKKNIDLSMLLYDQNDELLKKIEEVKKQIAEEEIKYIIFNDKVRQNQKQIQNLKLAKEQIIENQKMLTLNESTIPNKSVELGSTLNTNGWFSELLTKEESQNSLWLDKSKKQIQMKSVKKQSKIKSYTIDISGFMASARKRPQNSAHFIEREAIIDSYINQKTDIKSKIAKNNRDSYSKNTLKCTPPTKNNLKLEMTQKTKFLNKKLCQMRNLKKIKNNPQF